MERRSGLRKAIDMEVVLDSPRDRGLRGKIGNVGFGGLYVQLESGQLSKDAPVEIAILLQQESGPRVYRIRAFVARLAPNGAGLVFDEYDVTAFRALVLLLLTRQREMSGVTHPGSGGVSFSNGSGSDAAPTLEDTTKKAA